MQQCSLAEVCHIDPESLGKSTDSDYSFDYISLSDVVTGKVISDQVKHIRFSESPSRARKKVKKGDVLFSTVRPNLKGVVCLREDVTDTIASTGFSVIRPKDGTCGEFIYHALLSEKTEQQIAKLVAGSNYPAINSSDVKRLKIKIPSLEEQRRIAGILSTWEKAINAYDRLIALKEKQKRGLLQDLFLNSVNPDTSLGEICTLKGGSGFPVKFQGKESGTLPFIKVSDMNNCGNERLITSAKNWLDESEIPIVKPRIIPANSTVFAKVGAALLLNRRRMLSFDTAIDNNMMAAIPGKKIDYRYLFYFMQTVDMAKLVQEGALPSINQSQVGNIQVPLPTMRQQSRIASILYAWDKYIDALSEKRDLLKKQKQGLMQQLLA